MEQEYGLSSTGYIKIPRTIFLKSMKRWCGKIVTIKKVHSTYYHIKKGCIWNDEMIDHSATRIMSIIDRLEMLKDLVNCLGHKIKIDKDIKKLKTDQPNFSNGDVNYYNKIFRNFKKSIK